MSFPGKPNIYNVTMTTAGTEYSQAIPEVSSKVMIRCRQAYDLQFSYTQGQSNTIYITIPSGQTYWDDNVGTSQGIYLTSQTNSVVAEILVWSGS